MDAITLLEDPFALDRMREAGRLAYANCPHGKPVTAGGVMLYECNNLFDRCPYPDCPLNNPVHYSDFKRREYEKSRRR